MKVYVISLPSAKDRQQRISAQLSKAGIEFEVFMGVDGRAGKHPLFKHYNERRRIKIKGEPMLPGQLGCFASHYLLWQRCASEREPFIVLEDDAKIDSEALQQFIMLANSMSERFECVRLFENKSRVRKAVPVEKVGQFQVCKYFKGHMSTTGYYLTPKGAQKFIDSAGEWVLPVDIYMDQFWNNKVECYGIEPPCLTNDESLDSLIEYIPKKSKKRKTIGVRVRREGYLLANNFRRLVWNVKFLLLVDKLFKRIRF